MQDVEFKQNLSDLLKRKNNIHPVRTNKIIYTNGTGVMPYKDPRWFSDIYYYCSKYYQEQKQNDNTLSVTFFAGGNSIRVSHLLHIHDLTSLLSLLKERFINCPNEYQYPETCFHLVKEFTINFKFI